MEQAANEGIMDPSWRDSRFRAVRVWRGAILSELRAVSWNSGRFGVARFFDFGSGTLFQLLEYLRTNIFFGVYGRIQIITGKQLVLVLALFQEQRRFEMTSRSTVVTDAVPNFLVFN